VALSLGNCHLSPFALRYTYWKNAYSESQADSGNRIGVRSKTEQAFLAGLGGAAGLALHCSFPS
jgi:hypothetical protein